MVRAGIAASACKPMRALQAYPAENGFRLRGGMRLR
jgi:hypothetical protein